jgi:hypothetical protein
MSNNKIPTAEEFLDEQVQTRSKWVTTVMIEFAKLHVKAALEVAAKRAIHLHHDVAELDNNCNDYEEAAKRYIHESYPETLIK